MNWRRTLIFFTFWSVLAAAIQYKFQTATGWILLSIGSGVWMTWRSRQSARVARWSLNPQTDPPTDIGPWEDVVASLYRYTRSQSDALNDMEENNTAIMSAAQALPLGAVTLNKDFQIRWFNAAAEKQLHLQIDQDIGRNLLNLLRSPEFVSYARQTDWSEPVILKTSQSGQTQSIMMQLVPYSRDLLVLLMRDLTQIEKLETTRRDFVANVSHEMRTPLTVLAGFLETLLDAPPGAISDTQRQTYLTMMHEQAQRMQALVTDLLTLSDLETSPSAERVAINMAALIGAARQQIEALSGGRHVFAWHIDSELNLLGHEAEISSAFSNLLTNAVRYTPDGGRITVTWQREPNGRARYSVTDTGIGIASEHVPRLSERFYRVDRGRSRELGGTGLGLAITKHVAMRHDAQLDVKSKLGQGSTFSLLFDAPRVACIA